MGKNKTPEPNPFEFLVDDLFSVLDKEKLTNITLWVFLWADISSYALERKPNSLIRLFYAIQEQKQTQMKQKLKRVAGIKNINENECKSF